MALIQIIRKNLKLVKGRLQFLLHLIGKTTIDLEETIKIIKKRRQKLYEYGISVSHLNSLSTFAFNVFQTLREYTNEYYYSIQKTLEVAEEKMTKTINNQNLLLRAGLSNPQCDMLQTLLPLKIKTLQRQREPIEQNFKHFREMNNDLCKSMRQCYK